MRTVDLVITEATEILTCAGGALGGTTGAVAIDGGVIVAVGACDGVAGRRTISARGGVVMPGFVDAHTHVVFGGDRAQEYAARVAGEQPPAGAAVGIVGTTMQTRGSDAAELEQASASRIREMVHNGTTTVESKTGYGLRRDVEERLLLVNRALRDTMPVDIVSTYLGAHAFPGDVEPEQWVADIIAQIPDVAAAGLAEFCDVYCDEGYFTLEQTERILRTGLEHGLLPKVHLDAYSHTGAADLAIALGAVSVDHLNFTPMDEIERLADAGIVGVYMPLLDYAVAHPKPVDARAIASAGMELALATDICPGCWAPSMQVAIAVACRSGGLSVEQAIRAATIGAARASGRDDVTGSLEVGKRADVIILDIPSHEHLAYRIGGNAVTTVIAAGRVVQETAA